MYTIEEANEIKKQIEECKSRLGGNPSDYRRDSFLNYLATIVEDIVSKLIEKGEKCTQPISESTPENKEASPS